MSTFYAFHWDGEAVRELALHDFSGKVNVTLDEIRISVYTNSYLWHRINEFDPGLVFRATYPEAVFIVVYGEGLPDGFDTLVLLGSMPSPDDYDELLEILVEVRMFLEDQETHFNV